MQDNTEFDLAVHVRRRCKKKFPSVLSCIGKKTKKAVTVAAKSGHFTADNELSKTILATQVIIGSA